jgi:hypothetical protein
VFEIIMLVSSANNIGLAFLLMVNEFRGHKGALGPERVRTPTTILFYG